MRISTTILRDTVDYKQLWAKANSAREACDFETYDTFMGKTQPLISSIENTMACLYQKRSQRADLTGHAKERSGFFDLNRRTSDLRWDPGTGHPKSMSTTTAWKSLNSENSHGSTFEEKDGVKTYTRSQFRSVCDGGAWWAPEYVNRTEVAKVFPDFSTQYFVVEHPQPRINKVVLLASAAAIGSVALAGLHMAGLL